MRDQQHPVPDWLLRLDVNSLDRQNLPLANILERSVYYPASGLDGRPVQFLGGFAHSFIYVDYGTSRARLTDAVANEGFTGFQLSARKSLGEGDLAPNGWRPTVPDRFRDQVAQFPRITDGIVQKPFAEWLIFDRGLKLTDDHGPQRFSLLYICADGIATYQALYWQHRTAPEVLVIIQPGTGFGGNYTDFRDPTGFFAWTVLKGATGHTPKYLVYGGIGLGYTESCWPDAYPDHVEWLQKETGNGIWKRRAGI